MPLSPRQKPVFRFAPSPNGLLHLGHAYSALLNQDMARACDGRLLLRLEDIDLARCTPAFETAILDDLDWLGLRFEQPVRRQSEHFADYAAALDRLTRRGLVYPAFMTRGEVKAEVKAAESGGRLWPRDPDGAPLYPPQDRHRPPAEAEALIASGRPYALRLKMDKALAALDTPLSWQEEGDGMRGVVSAEPALWGDVILSRSDAPSSYHLSVVVDDALQGVTHVVRGQDLFAATAVHRLLQSLLGLPEPVYFHHRLILDAEGRKLSKSAGDEGLRAQRAKGASPADIRRLISL